MEMTHTPEEQKGISTTTPIITDSGWKTVSDLKETDLVYGINGNLEKIELLSEPFEAQLTEITVPASDPIYSTLGHPWTIASGLEKLSGETPESKFIHVNTEGFPAQDLKIKTLTELYAFHQANPDSILGLKIMNDYQVKALDFALNNAFTPDSTLDMAKEVNKFAKGRTVAVNENSSYAAKELFLKTLLYSLGETQPHGTGRYYLDIHKNSRTPLTAILKSLGYNPVILEPSQEIMFQSETNYYEGTDRSNLWATPHEHFLRCRLIPLFGAPETTITGEARNISLTSGKFFLAGQGLVPVIA